METRFREVTKFHVPAFSNLLTDGVIPGSAEEIRLGANAATLRMIMTSAKRYIPMVKAIPACSVQIQINQNIRVLLPQIKNGYPISNTQVHIPATGKRYFHLTSSSGSTILKGGRIRARHTLEPSHQPLPRHFVRPLKK